MSDKTTPLTSEEARLHYHDGRYNALLQVYNYVQKAAANAFMGFTPEGDIRANELRSLGAMFGRWADEAKDSRLPKHTDPEPN